MSNETVMLPEGRVGLLVKSRKHGVRILVIDVADYPSVSLVTWGVEGSPRHSSLYGRNSRVGFIHRVLLPGHEVVDHIDRNGLNNTRSNLRGVTKRENALNSKLNRRNTTGFRGVSYSERDGVYRAEYQDSGVRVVIGLYRTAEDAARAWDSATEPLHGGFWQPNFPHP